MVDRPVREAAVAAMSPAGPPPTTTTSYSPMMGMSRASSNATARSEEHTSELQSRGHLVCRLLLDNKTLENSAQVREVFRQRSANGARSEGRRMGQPRPERLLRAD